MAASTDTNHQQQGKQQQSSPKARFSDVIKQAASSAFRGGVAGFVAMILQVWLLMWLRTVVNYQYRHNVSILEAFQILYNDGGIARFYQGASFALLSGPLARFGDTAANEGIKVLLNDSSLSVDMITMCASFTAAIWRVLITPIDTIKTSLQVSGRVGFETTMDKVKQYGILTLYDGALGNWASNMVGHYPWFAVNNQLELRLSPTFANGNKQIRRAFIGFCSSVVADFISNGVRVLKTYKQTSDISISYMQALTELMAESGILFLFRGLGMKLLSNALSSILFSIVWKMLMDKLQQRNKQSQQEQQETKTDRKDK